MRFKLILASTSSTRFELLSRLALPFEVIAPEVIETALDNESAEQLSIRLAEEKAQAVAILNPDAWVIGSDQVASLTTAQHSLFLNKPMTVEKAIAQLQASSGNYVYFHTAVSLQHHASQFKQTICVPFSVKFRTLSEAEITRYVEIEQPLYCAGSFKVEGLGITLFESLTGEDFTALMGLPLLALCQLLRKAGLLIS